MPELPEVETVRRELLVSVLGAVIKDSTLIWPLVVEIPANQDLRSLVCGRSFVDVRRRGKYLLLDLSGGMTFVVHFRMTGRLIFYQEEPAPDKHTHLIFHLEYGSLHYSDTRKFGRIQIVDTAAVSELPALKKLGPDPLADDFEFDELGQQLTIRYNASIKAALLDQRVVAGLGNIYTDELLFRAGVHPNKTVAALRTSEILRIHQAMREILQTSIAYQGTTFRDYRHADGSKGEFQNRLQVYGRYKQSCRRCQTKLVREQIAGRTTVYCPLCQV